MIIRNDARDYVEKENDETAFIWAVYNGEVERAHVVLFQSGEEKRIGADYKRNEKEG